MSKDIAERRLKKELEMIAEELPDKCVLNTVGNDLYRWSGYIVGPPDTPYEGGKFKINIKFTDKYPMQPPNMNFTTRIYHPNIAESGSICLDILKHNWSPALRIHKVLHSLISLFDDPNPSSSLNGTAGRLYKSDKTKYDETVRQYVRDYAQ